MNGKFRSTIWDPTLIISQIVALQAIFYFSYGSFIIIFSFIGKGELSMDSVFLHESMNFNDKNGIFNIAAYVLTSFVCSLGLWLLVQRAKLCLDFSTTVFAIHFIISYIYNFSWPYLSWWLITIAAVSIMCVVGEFLCIKSDMIDIPLIGARVDL